MLHDQQLPENYEVIGNNFTIFSQEFSYMSSYHSKTADSFKKSNETPMKHDNLSKEAWIDPSKITKRISIFTNKIAPATKSVEKLDFVKQEDNDVERIIKTFSWMDIKMLIKV